MSKSRNYSTTKSQFVQNKMKEGYSNKAANNVWKKSDERAEFENNQHHDNTDKNESDFNSDVNGNGTNWHTSEDL